MGKDSLRAKRERLAAVLKNTGPLLIAFSGGVDSAFLLAIAREVLGSGVLAATAHSPVHPAWELEQAQRFVRERGIEHVVLESREMNLPDFTANRPDRCYHCKKSLFAQLQQVARERGLAVVAHGATRDDLKDYRPGLEAARQMGVSAPLVEAGLGKAEIRILSQEMGLFTWDRPSMACLATRIPYGSDITADKLEQIEQAEDFLHQQGFWQCRVRHHGPVARIEVERAKAHLLLEGTLSDALVSRLRGLGFAHVALDLEGYVSGSMNRDIHGSPREVTDVRED